jgi:hypothetical protein
MPETGQARATDADAPSQAAIPRAISDGTGTRRSRVLMFNLLGGGF